MNDLDTVLRERLDALREQRLYRQLRLVESAQGPRIMMGGQSLLNYSSNDYLGLANAPALKEAALQGLKRYGAGAGASRLISGSLAPHHELDEALATFKGAEAALTFATGYTTALGVIPALLGREDVIVLDKLVHACIVDAARLSGAKMRVFAHNDLNDLEGILRWADSRLATAKVGTSRPWVLLVTESVFSMDGDHAPLPDMVRLKDQYGAWLMVDEAHATGLYGSHRRGLCEELGVSERIEIQMGTLGKAIGASGGYVCGSRVLMDYLINRARPFIFSTAPVPAAAAAATAGVRFVQSAAGEERRQTLWRRVGELRSALNLSQAGLPSAIIPLLIGDENKTVAASNALCQHGIFIPAVRYPTVARGSARLRLTLTAAHSASDVALLAQALERLNLVASSLRLEGSIDASPR